MSQRLIHSVSPEELQQDRINAIADLRKAVLEGASDEWILGFVWGYPFNNPASFQKADGSQDIATTNVALNIPTGYRLVKIEPDDNMQLAGAQSIRFETTPINKLYTGNRVFKAMCEASPQPSTSDMAAYLAKES